MPVGSSFVPVLNLKLASHLFTIVEWNLCRKQSLESTYPTHSSSPSPSLPLLSPPSDPYELSALLSLPPGFLGLPNIGLLYIEENDPLPPYGEVMPERMAGRCLLGEVMYPIKEHAGSSGRRSQMGRGTERVRRVE